jgi:recombination protein RecA
MNAIERAGLQLRMGRHLAWPKPHIPKGRPEAVEGLTRAELTGRLSEISGQGNSAVLTLAFALILDAQQEGEPVAWIASRESTFYPPDAASSGVDLSALAVVRCPDKGAVARAADRLARSGAFGLLVLDLESKGDVPLPLQTRLTGLAHKYDIAIVLLTEKRDDAPSVGSLISLRGSAERRWAPDGRIACGFRTLKDKRRGPGWERESVCHGPPGLC